MTDSKLAKRILPLIDLTNLAEDANDDAIKFLCQQAITPFGKVAAVCVFPKFITLAKTLLDDNVKIATVCNFPNGNTPLNLVIEEIATAIKLGANEIDVVLPYHEYLVGKIMAVIAFISECKKACGPKVTLKVILETGALQQPEIIAHACRDVILAGADFIKTSTGKIAKGATLEDAQIILEEIQQLNLNRTVGFKAAGGIRTLRQAADYLKLAEKIMGTAWISPATMRFGSSSLLSEIIATLN